MSINNVPFDVLQIPSFWVCWRADWKRSCKEKNFCVCGDYNSRNLKSLRHEAHGFWQRWKKTLMRYHLTENQTEKWLLVYIWCGEDAHLKLSKGVTGLCATFWKSWGEPKAVLWLNYGISPNLLLKSSSTNADSAENQNTRICIDLLVASASLHIRYSFSLRYWC